MKIFKLQLVLTLVLLALNLTVKSQTTVVDIVVNSADHDTLEAAVIAAGLADDLSGDGPFTVFAPTDNAFKALPAGTIEALLADPTGDLADILLYHVVSGKVMSTDLSDGMMATTLLGKDIEITIDGGNVFINDAMVTVADIEADNGVVHVIDAVLLPPSTSAIGSITEEKYNLSVFPNPANDYIEISLENAKAIELNVEIINTSGLSVSNNILFNSNSITLELDNLLPGIYFVRITGNNAIETKRFVIAR